MARQLPQPFFPRSRGKCPRATRGDDGGAAQNISREDRWSAENFKPVRFRSSWPLALRFEALICVYNDPTAYARRLARRLHAKPQRIAQALRAPPEAIDRVDHFELIGERAETAWSPHFSSA